MARQSETFTGNPASLNIATKARATAF